MKIFDPQPARYPWRRGAGRLGSDAPSGSAPTRSRDAVTLNAGRSMTPRRRRAFVGAGNPRRHIARPLHPDIVEEVFLETYWEAGWNDGSDLTPPVW